MTWYKTGTVSVTNGSPNVTLASGNAQLNIFPDDGFVGPDGRTYAILAVNNATQFVLSENYRGPTISGQNYVIIPTADHIQLRDMLVGVNTLIDEYETVKLNAGAGRFASGTAASPGVRGITNASTGLRWDADGGISIIVNGVAAITWNAAGTSGPMARGNLGNIDLNSAAAAIGGSYRMNTVTNGPPQDVNFSQILIVRGALDTITQIIGNFNTGAVWTRSGAPASVGGGGSFTTWRLLASIIGTGLTPEQDNIRSVGLPTARWTVVYATTGTINTSDETEKTEIRPFTPEELSAAKRIAKEVGVFQWLKSVEEKGEDARLHFGVGAQTVWDIMADEGLIDPYDGVGDPTSKYAFLCWDDLGEDGARFGVRYDQLSLFISVAQEQRISALEDAHE